ncbi:MAG: tRNA-dihydrouridine synthase, partial [Pseudomonadota bacterium]
MRPKTFASTNTTAPDPTELRIGPIAARNRAFLAPLSGISDAPFRALADSLGAGLVVSEMVASSELVRGRRKAVTKAAAAGNMPFVIQLAGHEARWMREGARVAEGLGADVIDINMGCPAREVTGKLSGSALMRDLDHAVTLIASVVGATTRPVTLKMRLGWDDATRNAVTLAERAEQAGVQMITVHGRTRCQFYKGRADWAAVGDV